MEHPLSKMKSNGRRKSILDMAPLELDCLNTLWPLGEASVRDIRDRLAVSRPRAYTTIMTIMDRLAHKGVVTRRKSGRAYLYCANLTAEQARSHALEQLVEGFFGGSTEALLAHLRQGGRPVAQHPAPEMKPAATPTPPEKPPRRERANEYPPPAQIDKTLL